MMPNFYVWIYHDLVSGTLGTSTPGIVLPDVDPHLAFWSPLNFPNEKPGAFDALENTSLHT
jgi:hypothetical protein